MKQTTALFSREKSFNHMVNLISLIDSGYFDENNRKNKLAKNGKHFNKIFIKESDKSNEILDQLLSNMKRKRVKIYKPVLNQIIANALRINTQTLYSRRRNTDPHVRVIDFLAKLGYLANTIAPRNTHNLNKITSYFEATKKLLDEFKNANYLFSEACKTVQFKDGDKKTIDGIPPTLSKPTVDKCIQYVNKYNKFIEKHTIKLKDKTLYPFMFQSFSYKPDSPTEFLGGRYYQTSIQQLPSSTRKALKINGKPTCELDYKALHPRLLYSLHDLTAPSGDMYSFGGYDRKISKLLFMVLMNGKKQDVRSRISLSKNSKMKRMNDLYIRGKTSTANSLVKSVIQGVGDTFSADDWIESCYKHHHQIKHLFETENISLKLQFSDSKLMAEITKQAMQKDIAIYGVHDSVIVNVEHKETVKLIMENAYFELFNAGIEVK